MAANGKSSLGLTRRTFIKTASGVATTAAVAANRGSEAATNLPARAASCTRSGRQSAEGPGIRVQGERILVETGTLSAVIEKGFIISLKSKPSGEEYIRGFDISQSPALGLVYRSDETVGIDESRFGSIRCRRISDRRAEVIFQSWDGDGVLAVGIDAETGDLILEPAAYSSRPGIRACRWSLRGVREDLLLFAPFFQGVKLKLEDPLIRDSRW